MGLSFLVNLISVYRNFTNMSPLNCHGIVWEHNYLLCLGTAYCLYWRQSFGTWCFGRALQFLKKLKMPFSFITEILSRIFFWRLFSLFESLTMNIFSWKEVIHLIPSLGDISLYYYCTRVNYNTVVQPALSLTSYFVCQFFLAEL
jgi:hypothetical protein